MIIWPQDERETSVLSERTRKRHSSSEVQGAHLRNHFYLHLVGSKGQPAKTKYQESECEGIGDPRVRLSRKRIQLVWRGGGC